MIENAISRIAVPIIEQLIKAGGKAGGYAVNEAKKAYNQTQAVQQVIAASNEYVKKYEVRHGQIKVMPGLMKEPLPLESIYTAVKLLDDRSIRYFASSDDLEEAYRESGRRGLRVGNKARLDGMDIANQKQYLMVLGSPGVGKSTFLRKLGLEALKPEGQFQRKCIPVFIELKEFKGETLDLKQVIAEEFETCGFPAAEDFTASMLNQGKLLVLLDGLDEVSTRNFNRVIEHIENFVDRYDQNGFVASCRIAAYKTSFRRFTDVTIAEFDDDQIEWFIQRWFSSELDQQVGTARTYWELLNRDEHKATKELAQTPLLLTYLCLAYNREQTLPNVLSKLYDTVLDTLLSKWAAQKRLERDPIYEGFHPGLEKLLLANIAHDSFEQDQLFFSKDNILGRIAEFLANTLDAPKSLDGEKVLTAIEVQQGILVERTANTYSFSHLTLQEYLTALYIVKKRQVDDLVTRHLTDNRWREVFLLVAGLMEDQVHELLDAIDQQALNYLDLHQKVHDLIKWTDSVIDTSSEKYKLFAKRATALAIASASARAIDRDSASASASDIAKARAIAILRDIASISTSISTSASDSALGSVIANTSALGSAILANARDRDRDFASASALASALASAKALVSASDITSDITSALAIDSALASARAITSASANARNIARARDVARASNIILALDGDRDRDITRALASEIASDIALASDIASINQLIEAQVFKLENLSLDQLPAQLSQLQQSIPQHDDSSEQWRQWTDQFESAWPKALNLTKEALIFSKEEAEALQNYLYANELLIRCKQSAVRVPRKAWEDLEARLLTVANR